MGTIALLQQGILKWPDLPSSVHELLNEGNFPSLACGGWDIISRPFPEILSAHDLIPERLRARIDPSALDPICFQPVVTALDYAADAPRRLAADSTVGSAVSSVIEDVLRFQELTGCQRSMVIYLASPARRSDPPLSSESSWPALMGRGIYSVASNLIYAAGAVEAGADFVDFTPSEALTCPALLMRSRKMGVQVAGRDGSTGQTMLKAAIAQMVLLRGLRLRSWYSSNNLGNHDGLVLSDPEFSWLKMADKKRFLNERQLGTEFEHVVSIDYLRSRGDRKEAFDSVIAEDLFGGEVNIKVNWEGWDSALAVPMLLDLVRLIAAGQKLGLSGPQVQLGYFFKSPIDASCESPERGHELLARFYAEMLNSE